MHINPLESFFLLLHSPFFPWFRGRCGPAYFWPRAGDRSGREGLSESHAQHHHLGERSGPLDVAGTGHGTGYQAPPRFLS